VLLILDIGGGTLSDPKSIFDIKKTSIFSSDIRSHAASALRVSDADCVIIGTSMLSNTSPQLIREKHGIHCINVSMLGASLYERILVLRYALTFENYKTVILSVDYFGDYGRPNPAVDLESYDFLYDASKINDLVFYIGFQWVAPTLRNLAGNMEEAASKDVWKRFHDAVRWDSPREMLRFGGLDNWIIDVTDSSSKKAVGSLIKQINKCDKALFQDPYSSTNFKHSQELLISDLSALMATNKDVRFIGIIPPYSTLKRALDLKCEPQKHKRFMAEINRLVKLSAEESNFTVHGFDNDSFVTNLDNYKDTRHYSPSISDQIVDSVLQGINQVDEINIREYGDGIVKNVRNLNMQDVRSRLNSLYQANE
jgi:hypothetical protein